MAQQAIGPGATRKRVLFGLLDADGWSWAFVKAAFWFVVIIMLLGYIPDRAYYFTVFSTISIGMDPQAPPASYVTPINLCPPTNQSLPCPAPLGSVLPWQPSPDELDLPAPRTGGAAIQVGTKLLYIGGSDGTAPTTDTFVAEIVDGSTFDHWQAGPALPAARSNAAVVFANGSIYLIGGLDAEGKPTATVYSLTPDPDTGQFGDWTPVDGVALPAPRSGAAVVAAPDGLIVVGGSDTSGPTTTVWKSDYDSKGALEPWVANTDLAQPRTHATAALVGSYLWVYGGVDTSGPTAAIERGLLVQPPVPDGSPPGTLAPPSYIGQWAITAGPTNLPVARTDAAGFTANGSLYLVGGTDGTAPASDVYWAIPSAQGELTNGWQHLDQSDLGSGVAGGAPVVSGATAFVVGGTGPSGVLTSTTRANLAPEKPFFQVSLLGLTIPALKIEGEIGQQLGYLNAAGAGTVDFIILAVLGVAFAHKERSREIIDRLVRRRRSS